jgi:hypothetical protein
VSRGIGRMAAQSATDGTPLRDQLKLLADYL